MEKPNDLNQRIAARAFGRAFEAVKKSMDMNLDNEILSESKKIVNSVKYNLIPNGIAEPLNSYIQNKIKEADYTGFVRGFEKND